MLKFLTECAIGVLKQVNKELAKNPYKFNEQYPFGVIIDAFYYCLVTGTDVEVLTPSNGSLYWPPEGDYEKGNKVVVTYQIVFQNANTTEQAQVVTAAMNSAFTGIYLSYLYTNGYFSGTSLFVS